jgi:hypothetical protein
MVETIAPVVHGGRNRRYWTATALHAAGATLSASLFGGALGGLGGLIGAPWGDVGLLVLVTVALIYAVRELFRLPIPLPDLDRQVPEWWRTFFSRNVAAFFYGLGLGIGFLTFLSFGTYVAVAVAALVSGEAALGALVCGAFGLARGLSAAASATSLGNQDELLERLDSRTWLARARAVNGAALAAITLLTGLLLVP